MIINATLFIDTDIWKILSSATGFCALVISLISFLSSKRDKKKIEYNMISKEYRDVDEFRNDLLRTEKKFIDFEEYRTNQSEELKNKLANIYKRDYHDSSKDSEEFILCRRTRKWLDQLDVWGQMIKDRKIQENILFNVIGSAFEIDYPALSFVVEGHRLAHPDTEFYKGIDILKKAFDKWKKNKK